MFSGETELLEKALGCILIQVNFRDEKVVHSPFVLTFARPEGGLFSLKISGSAYSDVVIEEVESPQ